MLDTNDEKTIDKISFNQVFQAMQDVIMPKFDEIDKRFDSLEGDMGEMKGQMGEMKGQMGEMKGQLGELKVMSEVLDRDMTGVKMRLSEVEKKVETLIDMSYETKLQGKRISNIEAKLA